MRSRAAVLREVGQPFRVEDLDVAEPREGEVLVRIVAAGICHSDQHFVSGYRKVRLPIVLGHEGAGVVEAVGPGVVGLTLGDPVIQMFVAPCGQCRNCSRGLFTFCELGGGVSDGSFPDGEFRFSADGEAVGSAARLASYSTMTVCPAASLVKVPPSTDLEVASLVSCGVATGVGSVFTIADVQPGDAVVVFGLGGVGGAAVQAASIAGARAVIAVDIVPQKLDWARTCGATHTIDASREDVGAAVQAATDGAGADAVILAASKVDAKLVASGADCVGYGASLVVVGLPAPDLDILPVHPGVLLRKQVRVTGTLYGGPDPRREILRCLDLVAAGRLDLKSMVSNTYTLDEINQGFADMLAGRNLRGVVLMGGAA